MLITILTTGTRGDTQPYITLGIELKKAGYTVRIAGFENYRTFVTDYGLDFFPIKGDITRVASGDDGKNAMQADNPLKVLLSFNKLQSYVFKVQQDLFEACTGSDAIVYHPGAAIGYFAAQYLKVPSILATPFPMTPTRDYPALIFYDSIRLGKPFNRLTHKIFGNIMWFASRAPVKQFWKNKFGRIPENFGNPFDKQITSKAPTVISCSNYVFPRPNDWPEHVQSTGYWFLENEGDWKPSADLEDFLQRGTPPVYVGFGSIGDHDLAAQTTRIVVEALKACGQRGILATGWNGLAPIEPLPGNIFMLESAPHTWLFPRMAAVVHHGGAGTTAAGLKAGVPTIIIPHSNDQFAWGRRVYELGVGSKPIPRKKLTAENLADAIKLVLEKDVKEKANELGLKIQSERGSEAAAKIIIGCLQ